MANEQYGSGTPGSPISSGPMNPNELPQAPVGQPQGEMIPKSMYDELFTKFGQQGNEIGEYRKFVEDLTPLLEKLDKEPEIAQAVLNEKFDATLAKAILDNRVSVGEAAVVQKAHEDVKTELGKKAYTAASSEDIAKMVEEKVREQSQAIRQEIEGRDELRSFEAKVNEFIANTRDFPDYADQISEWLEDHPDITDVETAYYAVKGKLSEGQVAQLAARSQAEAAKDVALNAAGGQGTTTYIRKDEPLIDRLIAPRSDPNYFG